MGVLGSRLDFPILQRRDPPFVDGSGENMATRAWVAVWGGAKAAGVSLQELNPEMGMENGSENRGEVHPMVGGSG